MAKNKFISGTFISTLLFVWLGWSVLHVSFILWLHFPAYFAIGDCLMFTVPLLLLCFLQLYTMQYYLPKKEKISYIAVSSAMIALLVTIANVFLEATIFSEEDRFKTFITTSYPVRFGVAFLLVACLNMVTTLINTLEDQKKNEQRRHEAEQLSKEAELFNLRSQLQPHFLFNSLNSISALAGSKPEEARKMIQQLSDFFRGTIKRDNTQMASLQDELHHLQLYLEIEKVRFGHRLVTCIEADDDTQKLLIPPLILQPVMENAIKFGLYDTIGTVNINIKATTDDHMLVITITNPFDPSTTKPRTGTRFGLIAVQRRLFLLFSRNDLLITNAEDDLFTTIIKIPQLK